MRIELFLIIRISITCAKCSNAAVPQSVASLKYQSRQDFGLESNEFHDFDFSGLRFLNEGKEEQTFSE